MNIEGDISVPYGYGAFSDTTGGTPQPANFMGQTGWWTVPTSWHSWTDENGQIFVSPDDVLRDPKFAVKINLDGCWVFYSVMANFMTRCGRSMSWPVVSAPLPKDALLDDQGRPILDDQGNVIIGEP